MGRHLSGWTTRTRWGVLACSVGLLYVQPAPAEVVDRAVVRFSAPEAGGREQPHFVFERELAFEARLVALGDPAHRAGDVPYRRHHLVAALEAHVAETLMASLAMTPEP